MFFLFSFIIFSYLWTKTAVKPLNSKKKSWRNNSEKLWKSVKMCGKLPKSAKSAELILPFSCCPLVFFELSGFRGCPKKACIDGCPNSGSEKGVFWKRGLFRKVHFLEILENLETLEILESPQTLENKRDSDHFLEILENLEILEILEIHQVKRP